MLARQLALHSAWWIKPRPGVCTELRTQGFLDGFKFIVNTSAGSNIQLLVLLTAYSVFQSQHRILPLTP